MDIGRIGIWTFQLDTLPATKAQETVAELGELGYGAVWIPEAVGREAPTFAGVLLAGTKKVVIATGITNMWGRDAVTMNAAHRTLSEAYPERFLLGIGASHQHLVEGLRGHKYEKPLSAMREYLEKMDSSLYRAVGGSAEPSRVLAALGPKMLALAAEKTMGAHPYFVPVEHTKFARGVLGEGPLLAPEQALLLETDPEKARKIARDHMAIYLRAPNYTNNLRRMGFGDDDLAEGGSDRLVDAIVAWGDVDALVARVKAHHEAGADHVCVQVLTEDPQRLALPEWRELAPALLSL